MNIDQRIENPILQRVELHFTMEHPAAPTPSLKEMIDFITKMEPGSKKECTFILDVTSRFGRSMTTGVAHVYENDEAAATTVPNYVKDRHVRRGAHAEAAAAEPQVEEAAPEEESNEEESEEGA
ncbi:MAG TPA: hypothetical protein HA330_04240 [Candidatus Thalassarchaeaceae archaeon]|nr:MAG TPA: hypothetical protein D7H85_04240 [Candidatus Poseidoniales archaeon]HII49080.1 hypothetical protein [Candidatus Thalassarchaeaceae archaeon]|tara:strand:+ start:1585 stop:1956 length:372 start_codon:yes stop_codon:yes gene_type:complete